MDDAIRDACERYVAELFAPEDEVLVELRRAMDRADFPQIYISAEEGKLLQVLLRTVDARRVLELGTLGGYSAIWMGRALPADGRLITIEMRANRAELARDPGYVMDVLRQGTAVARQRTEATLAEVRDALGLFRLET